MPSHDPDPPPAFDPLLQYPPLWRELYQQLRDRLHPPPEPDLRLESKPIPVKDIWSRPQPAASRWGSAAAHVAVIGLLMLPFWRPVRTQLRKVVEEPVLLAPLPPTHSLPAPKHLAGGGAPLLRALAPVVPRYQPPPQLTIPVLSIPVQQTPAAESASLFTSDALIGGPPGVGGGRSGNGPGGPGSGSGGGCTVEPCGDGMAGLTLPIPIYQPDPEYSDEARKAKFQGTVVINVRIGTDGKVYDPTVITGAGYGLDEKAIAAVRNWRFQPARRNGQPVEVAANVEVNFRLY